MANLDRGALRAAMAISPMEVIKVVNRLDYRRGTFENGLEVIADADGDDWVALPSFTIRQANEFFRQWIMVPSVDMGRWAIGKWRTASLQSGEACEVALAAAIAKAKGEKT